VRRIEAVTGPEAVRLLRAHDELLRDAAALLRTRPEDVPDKLADLQAKAKSAAKGAASGGGAVVDVESLLGEAEAVDGARVLTARVPGAIDQKALLDVLDRVKPKLGDAAVVLGGAGEGKVAFVASVTPALVARGLHAGNIVKLAAQVTGGGGGRDTMAQAGGRDPEKLDEALGVAREAIERALRQ
jgi:alanyl-tRNA synthetase